MPNYMIVDGNSIGYAAHNTQPLSVNGMEVQAIYQALKMLRTAKNKFPQFERIIWLWDGKAKFRIEALPDYKANRVDSEEKVESKAKYKEAEPYLREMLTSLGIDQIMSPEHEADDLAGFFVRRATEKGDRVLLLTGDGDWLQLVNGLTEWVDPRKGGERHCNKATFKEYTGVDTPAQFLECKALLGDVSDNIPGVPGIGDKTAKAIMDHFGSIKNLVKAYRENGGPFEKGQLPDEFKMTRTKVNDFLSKNFATYRRNYQLMNLATDVRDKDIAQNVVVTRGKRDFDKFADQCSELQFQSILRTLNAWERIF